MPSADSIVIAAIIISVIFTTYTYIKLYKNNKGNKQGARKRNPQPRKRK